MEQHGEDCEPDGYRLFGVYVDRVDLHDCKCAGRELPDLFRAMRGFQRVRCGFFGAGCRVQGAGCRVEVESRG